MQHHVVNLIHPFLPTLTSMISILLSFTTLYITHPYPTFLSILTYCPLHLYIPPSLTLYCCLPNTTSVLLPAIVHYFPWKSRIENSNSINELSEKTMWWKENELWKYSVCIANLVCLVEVNWGLGGSVVQSSALNHYQFQTYQILHMSHWKFLWISYSNFALSLPFATRSVLAVTSSHWQIQTMLTLVKCQQNRWHWMSSLKLTFSLYL